MDKYQKYFIDLYSDGYNELFKCKSLKSNDKNKKEYFSFDDKNDIITIKQDEDITKTRYELTVNAYGTMGEGYVTLEKVEYHKNNTWISVQNENNLFKIIVDFNDKIDKIKLGFVNSLADELVISIVYQEADKEAYYAKKEQEYKDNLLKTADIKVSTGADLVNIYFQPCCDKYEYTEIQLYIPKEFVTVGGPYGPVQKPSTWSMIKKSKVDPEEFYKSINGLANGKYSFILKQYDKDNAIILETGHIEFTISTPKAHGIRPHINRI